MGVEYGHGQTTSYRICRGTASCDVARQRIVRDDDRQRWIEWLRRTVETYGWRLHCFVLMPNHHHLFVETPEANLSDGMQYLNGSFTGYFDRRHRRSGHLFQGRFKGHLAEEEGYFLEISRYVHLNPVRGRLVERPEPYRWSNHPGKVLIRLGRIPDVAFISVERLPGRKSPWEPIANLAPHLAFEVVSKFNT